MSPQILVGANANDGTGDSDRVAYQKFNQSVRDAYNVKYYGALGSGSGDDSGAINAARAAAAADGSGGGAVFFPHGIYRITNPILSAKGVSFIGENYNVSSGQTATAIVSAIPAGTGAYAVLPPATGEPFHGVQFHNLKVLLDTNVNANMGGINLSGSSACILNNVFVDVVDGVTMTGGSGIFLGLQAGQGGLYNVLHNVNVQDATIGFEFGGGAVNLNWLYNCRVGTCATGYSVSGAHNVFVACDAEICTTAFVIGSGSGTGHHIFMSPHVESVTTAFSDLGESGSWVVSPHFNTVTTKLSGGALSVWLDTNMKSSNNDLTYGTTVVIDPMTRYYRLVVTNGVGFTMQNPTAANSMDGQELIFEIVNNSGGAMGAITWDTQFSLAGAFVNPATGKRRTIHFMRYGSNWREISRAAADI